MQGLYNTNKNSAPSSLRKNPYHNAWIWFHIMIFLHWFDFFGFVLKWEHFFTAFKPEKLYSLQVKQSFL